jgi:exosortase/archaeosortase family protein
VPTDIVRSPTSAGNFVAWALAASLGLFGLLRLPWVESHAIWPLTLWQGDLAFALFGLPARPVDVTLACSGAEALALCVGAVIAYPVRASARIAGAAGGIAVILLLNTLRIGTLGRAVTAPSWFDALHLYIWPAVLTLAVAGYVFGWMSLAERSARYPTSPGTPRRLVTPAPAVWQPSRRFLLLTAAFLAVFAASAPLYLESPLVLILGGFIASAAAVILGAMGVTAAAAANVLSTSRGAFIVTQECISTPLIPVYLAAVCAYGAGWRQLATGVAATLPLFAALGVARLLIVALPAAVMTSPTFLVHAFYQLLFGAVVIVLAARWRHGGRAGLPHAAAGIATGALFVVLAGPWYAGLMTAGGFTGLDDPQGAVAFMPVFQTGLYLALWTTGLFAARWTQFAAGLGVLAATQVASLLVFHALPATGFALHVRDVRAWAVAGPVLIFAMVISRARASR